MKELLKKVVVAILTLEARAILRKYRPRVIAITGSVGKTTAKDAIYAALGGGPDIRKNEKSLNSELGVPLTIIGVQSAWGSAMGWVRIIWKGFRMMSGNKPYPKTLIMETGADHPGDIHRIARWLMPDVAVLTGVAPVHIAFFDSIDSIFKEKQQLAKHLRTGGWLALNADDERVRTLVNSSENVLPYGIEHGALRAHNIQMVFTGGKLNGIRFDVRHGAEAPIAFELNGVLGNAHVLAALAACAVGITEGMSLKIIAANLKKHTPTPGRMRVLDGVNNSIIIDDSYNSSPAAALLALDTLKHIPTTRRIAALGDMRELGSHSIEAHEAVGKRAAEVVDLLITVGIESKVLAEAARKARPDLLIKSYGYGESAKAGAELAKDLRAGDIVLVKGSQNMIRMEHFTKSIMADPAKAKFLLVRQDSAWLEH
ncbi:UDP-N-acetylmuramoyl-tripeptide--D-alanyl-D-alanine ligase [Candidatus Kaiserbacteria bacterium]|nr:UDP-N-acetylmuramoyl-tripeptide--D-alanyl-D-alanine ligase [Candidatus Kaiserbacteria bacterium]